MFLTAFFTFVTVAYFAAVAATVVASVSQTRAFA
jgi:hypothetical protein